mmetsp:Transcript_2607/g.6283  ORF Transcript_2607/g.6283 Transcript_2607/m.6283 type:complete len:112 (+) Transcript_2607:2-337(+)
MRIGVTSEDASELFTMFDRDGNGYLDRMEVLRHLFPDEYVRETQQIQKESLDKARISAGLEAVRHPGEAMPDTDTMEMFEADSSMQVDDFQEEGESTAVRGESDSMEIERL